MVQISSEIAQVNQMELRSGKKLPPVPNYGKILVQEFSQSKNRSSPNPEITVQDHGISQNQNPGGASLPIDRGAGGTLSSQNAVTQRGRPRMLAGQTLAANGQHVRYDILAHLKKIQALLSVYDALKISAELRMSLVYALTNPEEFSNEVNQVEMRSSEPTYAECLALITFTDDYLQPGLIKHNRPLFISGYLNGLEITRIMIDGGSAVNLLPLRMLKRLGIAIHRLAPSNLLIQVQGFHQSRQRSPGIVRLELKIEEWEDTIPLYVIDAETSKFYLGGLGCMIIVSSLLLITNVSSKPKVVSRRG